MAERRGRVCARGGDERRISLGREKTKRRGQIITANECGDEKICKIIRTASQLVHQPTPISSEETGLLQLEPRPRHPAEERIVEREVHPGRG